MTLPISARRAVSAVILSLAMAACSGDIQAQQPPQRDGASAPQVVPTVPATSPSAVAALPNFAPLVEKFGPAVVNVDVVQNAQPTASRGGGGGGGEEGEDPFGDFFRRFGIEPPGRGPGSGVPLRGSGSGFVVTPDGYILTNAHVVADADQVTVKLNDRREYPAKVIGIDQRTDVAVIKIDGRNLATVKIGD